MQLNVDEIVYNESFRTLDSKRVDYYKKEFEQGREVPPILVDENLVLMDGIHRLTAARLLKHKTISAQRHIQTPLDLHSRSAITDAISAATKQAVARIPFIDRRNASDIRCQLTNKKNQIRLQEEDQVKAEQTIVKLTGKIAALQTLLKRYRKLVEKQPHYAGLVDETSLKIRTFEADLEFWKKDLDRVTRIVDSLKKLLKGFLAQTPGKGFPSNGEMLAADDELKKEEREAANELNAASF
jgi:molecular chaperone DnaK (HSP70)